MTDDTKTCRSCTETKPLTGFYRQKTSPGGYQAVCKRCHTARSRGLPVQARDPGHSVWDMPVVLQVLLRTGEIVTDRRGEICPWLR